MGRGSSVTKLERLDQLLGKLQSGEALTASSLASELAVSTRTLMRDLETLRSRGYPIETEQGRGGGVRLYPRWGIGRLALNYREVIDLLLAMTVLEKLNSPLFLSHLESVRNKLYATFPDSQRTQIRQIRKRILIGELASTDVLKSYKSTAKSRRTDNILESFFDQNCLQIKYKREDGEISNRTIEIHFMFLNWPVWYLISFDHLRNETRMFRVDRVLKANLTEKKFAVKKLQDFSPELERFSQYL